MMERTDPERLRDIAASMESRGELLQSTPVFLRRIADEWQALDQERQRILDELRERGTISADLEEMVRQSERQRLKKALLSDEAIDAAVRVFEAEWRKEPCVLTPEAMKPAILAALEAD